MKWYNSIITKITLIFALSLIGIGAVLFTIHTRAKVFQTNSMDRFVRVVINSAYNKKDQTIDLDVFKKAGFILVEDKNKREEILKNRYFRPKHRGNHGHFRGKITVYKMNTYVIIQKNLIFKIPQDINKLQKIIFPMVAILLIVFLYIITIKSILPLYELRKKIKEFADGNYDIECGSNKKDEIGILSNEFNNSVKKIKKIRDSRQLFLRNIMHELKTPITKGKLACEMIEYSTYQDILKKNFRRQEALLEEFARIEKLGANELNINIKKYRLQDVIDFSLDILNHKKNSVKYKIEPMDIHVDFELFGTALKNILDNGINYSNDKKVLLVSDETKITISSSGEELEFPLENYAEPYFLDSKKPRNSQGFGFGLYITLQIIKLHKMKIKYSREKDRNVFTIDVKK
ncbi:MAG: HAMP domain-containing histidine kinase [Sulfurospirillum sp.]|nr:HAMP domain-containing histidine kinase [Sulfurospirillum sp.]MBL0703153.1 HAMP domain-containing histidine kinase [Sulfurospirillum sp.]